MPREETCNQVPQQTVMTSHRISADGVVYLPDSGERVPMSVVWTTLPGISFLFPLIGHVGIADSKGVIYDFSGPYQVTVGSLMCGPAKRIWKLQPDRVHDVDHAANVTAAYDAAVTQGACVYARRMHTLVWDNCHSHVAFVLNLLKYDGRDNWNNVRVFASIWWRGQWVRRSDAAVVFGPFLVLLLVAVGVGVSVALAT